MRHRVPIIIALALLMGGCFTHYTHIGWGARSKAYPVVEQHWNHYFLAGLIGEADLQLDRLCPSGHGSAKTGQGVLQGLISVVTYGIYTPTRVVVRCREALSAPGPPTLTPEKTKPRTGR